MLQTLINQCVWFKYSPPDLLHLKKFHKCIYCRVSGKSLSVPTLCGSWISCKSEMCLRNVLANLILQVMGCIVNYYQLSILLWGFFPAKCAILFISLAIILVLLPYTHTHWQASKTLPVMCFYKNIYIYIVSVCVSASISQCRPSCLLLNCCLFLLFFLFFFCCGGYDRSYLF